MPVRARWYVKGAQHFFDKQIGWSAEAFKVALHTSLYTPNADVDEFQSLLGDEVAAGGGYTQGGLPLTTIPTAIIDDAAVSVYANSTAYVVSDLVRPTVANGYIYRCIEDVTSRPAGEPTWTTTVGRDFADDVSGQQWENIASSYVRLDGNDVSWTPGTTITMRYAVIYVDGVDGTGDFVLGYIDFGQDESSVNGDLNIIFHTDGILQAFVSL